MSLGEAATRYAEAGWPVLPLRPRDKRPATAHGLLDASTDTMQIANWWEQQPECNIGLRTGIAFDVLDVDGPEGVLSMGEVAPGYNHPGPVASTGKGWHLLFAVTGAKNGANMRPKLDFRGHNGYIVAAPSIHPNGHRYSWARGDLAAPLPIAPDWLADMILPAPREVKARRMTEKIRLALDNSRVETALAQIGVDLNPIGHRYIGNCPFHQDDTPSLVVYPDTNSFFCFGCNEYGDALNVYKYISDGRLR